MWLASQMITARDVEQVLKKHKQPSGRYHISKAAKELGIDRHRLRYLMLKYNKFEQPKLPHRTRQIDELIRDRLSESERIINADEARDLIKVKINMTAP